MGITGVYLENFFHWFWLLLQKAGNLLLFYWVYKFEYLYRFFYLRLWLWLKWALTHLFNNILHAHLFLFNFTQLIHDLHHNQFVLFLLCCLIREQLLELGIILWIHRTLHFRIGKITRDIDFNYTISWS